MVLAWGLLGADNLFWARRERATRDALGPVVAGRRRPPLVARVTLIVLLVAGVAVLEHEGGAPGFDAVRAAFGLVLLLAALVLHDWARRALGPYWSDVVTVRADHRIVAHGPYAFVRHPIYLALFAAVLGSVLVHPSLAIACLAGGFSIGLGLKIRSEERLLRATLGEAYTRYAATVPACVPHGATLLRVLKRLRPIGRPR